MAFISLGEALDRVLEKLAVEREKRAGGKVLSFAAGKAARDQGEAPPVLGMGVKSGCGGVSSAPALRQRGSPTRDTGHPMADLAHGSVTKAKAT